MCKLIQAILKKNGISCDYLADPWKMPETLAKKSYELIILDICFQGNFSLGKQILKKIKESDLYDGKILMLSRKDSDIEVEYCIEAGAWDYIFKPIDEAVIVSKVLLSLGYIEKAKESLYFYETKTKEKNVNLKQTAQVFKSSYNKLTLLYDRYIKQGTLIHLKNKLDKKIIFKVTGASFDPVKMMYLIDLEKKGDGLYE